MKNQNILRLSGGADIKLKNKTASKKMLLMFVIGIAFCMGIYYFVDIIWNGSFVDWFMRNYMSTYDAGASENGRTVIVTEPNWLQLKKLLLVLLIVVVLVWLLSAVIAAWLYARKKVTDSITEASEMLQEYMSGNQEASKIFPKEYAEISAQMSEIKATMQRHEQILKEEAARKNDLITYLAHDLKTPLTSVLGYLSLLEEASDMPAEQKEKYVNIALDKAQRLEKLINEFFEITRYNLQQIDLEEETIDLYYMLAQMTDEFYPILAAHGNTIKLTADENLTIYGDSMKLARVFHNILKNAIAYSYRDTVIEVWTESLENEVRVYFRNKGKTIPAQKLNAIFEKFFRLDEARTTNTGGAGLGLAIAKEIVTLHGGTITAQSEKEFTTFCVSLPAGN